MENKKIDCEGRRLLMLKLEGMLQTEVARLLGTDDSAVSRWVHGSRKPDADMRFRMQARLGILAETWSFPPLVTESQNEAATTE